MTRVWPLIALLLTSFALTVLAAESEIPSSENLLPAQTRAWVSFPDLQAAKKAFDESRYGRLLDKPVMKDFKAEFWGRMDRWLAGFSHVDKITLKKWIELCTGELSLAVAAGSDGTPMPVLLADVRGNEAAAEDALRKALAGVSPGERETLGLHTIQSFAVKGEGGGVQRVAYSLADGLLVVGHVSMVKLLLGRLDGKEADQLAAAEGFRGVRGMLEAEGAADSPHVRWFADPMGLKELYAEEDENEGPFSIAFLRRHGFAGVQGAGGDVWFSQPDLAVLASSAVYSPLPRAASMKIFHFPDAAPVAPLPWAPADIDYYATLHWDMEALIRTAGPIFDDLAADGIEGTYRDILTDMKEQLGVDIEGEIAPLLGPRVTVIGDHAAPAAVDGERLLIAIETADEAKVAGALKKMMEDDPDVKRIAVPSFSHSLWQYRDVRGVAFPNMAMMVARDQLLIASQGDFLHQMLTRDRAAPLADGADFTATVRMMRALGDEGAFYRRFGRSAQELETRYVLLRQGKAASTGSLLARLVLQLIGARENNGGEDSEGEGPAEMSMDFTKLPQFDSIKDDLGATGAFAKNNPRGWTIIAFALE